MATSSEHAATSAAIPIDHDAVARFCEKWRIRELSVDGRSRADYDGDLALRRAVERATELIGEAASNVSESTLTAHPEIPWRKIIGQRHVLIHGYGDVDDDLVWNLTREEIPNLVRILESILREVERE